MHNSLLAATESDSDCLRVQALLSYNLEESTPELILRELAQMASTICETPIALVSLVDRTRQRFIARVGLESTGTPREDSFCTHALDHAGPLIIPDATSDLRFAANPLVTGTPNIRFYAGMPLRTTDGYALGTLCVIDRRPRELNTTQIAALKLLAQNVMAQLDLHRNVAQLMAANAQQKTSLLESLAIQGELQEQVQRQEREINQIACFSAQTGLPNRVLFMEQLAEAIREASGTDDLITIALVDMRRYDLVSESFAQLDVDSLLKEIADRLGRMSRDYGHDLYIAHLDGSRFAIFSRAMKSQRIAQAFLEAVLLPSLSAAFHSHQQELRLAFTVGLAQSASPLPAEVLVQQAILALQRAKDNKEPYEMFSPNMESRGRQILSLETSLRRALDRYEFELYYQPKVRLSDDTICGVEALLRWRDGSVEASDGSAPRWVSPALFVPSLESTGLIIETGRWILDRAAQDYLAWRAKGLRAPRIAVNISPIQLANPHFLSDFAETLDSRGGCPLLDVELTEAVIMDNPEQCIEILATLRKRGVQIAIDDFGTGFSSLRYLAKLSVDALKIDMSFIQAMTQGPDHMSIVSSVIALAHGLRLTAIAEGVETQEQRNLLRLLGCDQIQGYFISKAVDAKTLETLLCARESQVIQGHESTCDSPLGRDQDGFRQ